MNIELSEVERRAILGALEAYRRIKGAERMLTAHKEKDAPSMALVFERYDTLLASVTSLQKRLQP